MSRICALTLVAALLLASILVSFKASADEMDILVRKLVEKEILTPLEAQTILDKGEMNVLLDKLVEKGVFTSLEAQDILEGTQKEAEKEPAEAKPTIPRWVEKSDVKGDFRLRYEWKKRRGGEDRHRGIYRFRLGAVTEVRDNVEVGFGLGAQEVKGIAF